MMYETIVRRQKQLIAIRDAAVKTAEIEKPNVRIAVVTPIRKTIVIEENWSPVPERTRMENDLVKGYNEVPKPRASGSKKDHRKTQGTKTLGIHGCPVSVTARLGVLASEMSIAQGRKVSKSDVAIEVLKKALFPQ